ncbi:MAG: phage tail tape measure protein [Spirochaetota bacterium]|jgi:TP901 family phage tail tape measure protein|nr:phage tail tape measure protein [Spirochaetota bacterium]
MANKYAIETIFNLIDRVTAPTARIGKALDAVGIKSLTASNKLKDSFAKAEGSVGKLGKAIKGVGIELGKAAVTEVGNELGKAAVAGVGYVAKQYMTFDSTIRKAGISFSDLNPRAADFQDRLKQIEQAARGAAAGTEFDALQTAAALTTMAMGGIRSEQAIALLPKAANLATAACLDLDAATGMAVGTLKRLDLLSDDPLKLADNMQYVSDIMAKTARTAGASVSQISEAIAAGGAAFTKTNQSLADFAAAAVVLEGKEIHGAEAGAVVSAMMSTLSTLSAASARQLGIGTRDAGGNLLNFVDIIGQLEKRLKTMGTADQAVFLKTIFGKNYSGAAALINAGSEALRGYSGELKNAVGETEELAAAVRDSLENRIKTLKSSLLEVGFKIVEAFAGKGGEAIDGLVEAINKFDFTPITNVIKVIADIALFAFRVFMEVIKIVGQFSGVLFTLLVPFALLKGALIAVAIGTYICKLVTDGWAAVVKIAKKAMLIYKGVLAGLTWIKGLLAVVTTKVAGALGLQTSATIAATAAQWSFNAALLANPITWVILLVAALVAIVILVISYWDELVAAILDWGIVKGIIKIGTAILDFVLWPLNTLLDGLALLDNFLGGPIGISKAADAISDARAAIRSAPEALEEVKEDKKRKIAEKEAAKAAKAGGAQDLVDIVGSGDFDISKMIGGGAGVPDYGGMGGGTIPDYAGMGGSKSKGVVDISGGAGIAITGVTNSAALKGAGLPNAASTVVNPLPPVQTAADRILQGVSDAVSFLDKINGYVRFIANGARATLPRSLASDTPDSEELRRTSPITQSERAAYHIEEHIQRLIIEVAAEKGTAARVIRAPKGADIQLTRSGSNA